MDALPFTDVDYVTENQKIIEPIVLHMEEEDLPPTIQIPQEEEPIEMKIYEKQQVLQQTRLTITSTHTIIVLLLMLILFIQKPSYTFNSITRDLETKSN